MNLNYYRDEAGRFLKSIGASKEHVQKKIAMIEEELEPLKKSTEYPHKMSHQVYDLMFLLFEIAAQYDLDLEKEWNEGRQMKKRKYIKM